MKRHAVGYTDNGTVEVCAMCERAAVLESDAEHVLCRRKGIVARDFVCSRFSFDPLKFDPGEKAKILPPDECGLDYDGCEKAADDVKDTAEKSAGKAD